MVARELLHMVLVAALIRCGSPTASVNNDSERIDDIFRSGAYTSGCEDSGARWKLELELEKSRVAELQIKIDHLELERARAWASQPSNAPSSRSRALSELTSEAQSAAHGGSIRWQVQFGSSLFDESNAIAVDPISGDVYLVGSTYGDFAGSNGRLDALLLKLSGTSGVTEWTVQQGSATDDLFTAVATSPDGDVFVTGYTAGAVYQNSARERDVVVAGYDGTNGTQIWGKQYDDMTALGVDDYGAYCDYTFGITLAADGRIAVAGETALGDHRLPNDGSQYGGDFVGFVNAYAAGGNDELQWSTTFENKEGLAEFDSGESSEMGMGNALPNRDVYLLGIATDSNGDIFVSIYTKGTLFNFTNAGSEDAIIAKLNGTNGELIWTYHLGSTGTDRLESLAIDSEDNLCAAGYSDLGSTSIDTTTAHGPLGGYDVICVKLDGLTGSLRWMTRVGSTADDKAFGTVVDVNDDVHIVGSTDDAEGVVFGAEGEGLGGLDMLAVRLSGSYGTVVWSTQRGSKEDDWAVSVAASSDTGDIFVTGNTDGSFISSSSGNQDIFVLRLAEDDMVSWKPTSAPTPLCYEVPDFVAAEGQTPGVDTLKGCPEYYSGENWFYFAPMDECRTCPVGARCRGGWSFPIPDRGYWIDFQYPYEVHACLHPTNCRGGENINASCWSDRESLDLCGVESRDLCKPTATGPLCGTCVWEAEHRSYMKRDVTCHLCAGNEEITLTIAMTFAAAVVVVCFVLCRHAPQVASIIFRRTHGVLDMGRFKVLWVNYQILAAITWNLSITFPQPYQAFEHMLSTITEFSFLPWIAPIGCVTQCTSVTAYEPFDA